MVWKQVFKTACFWCLSVLWRAAAFVISQTLFLLGDTISYLRSFRFGPRAQKSESGATPDEALNEGSEPADPSLDCCTFSPTTPTHNEFLPRSSFCGSGYIFLPFLFDSLIIFFSIPITAFFLEDDFANYSSGFLIKNMFVFLLVSFSCFLLLRTYSHYDDASLVRDSKIETFINFFDCRRAISPLFVAIIVATILFSPLVFLLGQLEKITLSTIIWNIFTCLILIAIVRKTIVSLCAHVKNLLT